MNRCRPEDDPLQRGGCPVWGALFALSGVHAASREARAGGAVVPYAVSRVLYVIHPAQRNAYAGPAGAVVLRCKLVCAIAIRFVSQPVSSC
jgi:hypothetical protein